MRARAFFVLLVFFLSFSFRRGKEKTPLTALSTLTEGRPPRALRMASSSASAARERSTVRLAWAGAGERACSVSSERERREEKREGRGGRQACVSEKRGKKRRRRRRRRLSLNQPQESSHSNALNQAVSLLLRAPFCSLGVKSDAKHRNAPSSARKKARKRLAERAR